jgi:uncharacterized protein DUF6542
VTATRDRRSDPEEIADTAWDDRSIFGTSRGLPWWGVVLLAFVLAAIAAAFDMQRQDSLGRVYQGAYFVGCVAAICLVRRRSLFGPMVQPPLVFAVTAIVAVLLFSPDGSTSGGVKALIFTVALPLTSNFPTMAITTAVTAAIGVFRLYRERDPDNPGRGRRTSRARRAEPAPLDFDAAPEEDRPSRRTSSRDSARLRRGEHPSLPNAGRRDVPGRRGSRRGEPADLPEPEPRRSLRNRRDARPDQAEPRDRAAERARGRSRSRDADPPPRRRDPADAPRRRDRSDRSVPLRRRPEDPYR